MSDFSNIASEILSVWQSAVPGTMTSVEYVAFDAITPGMMPFTSTVLAEETSQELVALQEARSLQITFAQVNQGEDVTGMWTDLDAVRDALYADRTLGGLVDKLFIPDRDVGPPPSDNRVVGTMVVLVEWTQ